MKKMSFWAISFLLIGVILFSACGNSGATPAPRELNEAYVRALPALCTKEERKEVDFTVLQEVDFIVRKYSVFTSPLFEDVFGKTAKDRAYLMRAARDTLFTGFLSVPQDQIPSWAVEWVEEAIRRGESDYVVFNRIYQELLKDSKYGNLSESSQKEKLLKTMIEGMIKALDDPFTSYFTREHWIMSEYGSSEGSYRGLGVGLAKNERGEISISNVSAGSVAESAGLKSGDAILAVDEKSTLECEVSRFIVHVKTRENPEMNLIIRRKLANELERINVTMAKVRVQDLFTGPGVDLPDNRGKTSENLPFYYPLQDKDKKEHPDILYLKIKEFSVQAAQDLGYALNRLNSKNFKGVVIDLRGNPGGRLDAIIYCIDYFLTGEELITRAKYVDGTIEESRFNQWTLLPKDIPIAILVDKNSASGAELFPAALRDNKRAVIISADERTAGKGSVNRHYPLRKGEYGALYVSIGLWYTPSGQMIEKMDLDRDGYYEVGGLKPDILVEWTDEDIAESQRNPAWYDPTIFRAIEWLEGKR